MSFKVASLPDGSVGVFQSRQDSVFCVINPKINFINFEGCDVFIPFEATAENRVTSTVFSNPLRGRQKDGSTVAIEVDMDVDGSIKPGLWNESNVFGILNTLLGATILPLTFSQNTSAFITKIRLFSKTPVKYAEIKDVYFKTFVDELKKKYDPEVTS